ncbi:pseudouridylate synthase RPUSD2-like [Mercenaria mercenaria]|uniref:pseudouridylate synthase RPUSD2-like n=1 Tax=Mercenaria mercenaria TaxID=6596 RepID=UPI00234F3DF7|nr:pseudouridylate synthase RPUSD2-like [Mercenaria mercenaria]
MFLIRFFSKLHRFQLLGNLRMSSSSVKVKSSSKDYEEETSIRAQKRKRAHKHYQRHNKLKKPCQLIEEMTNETTYYLENGLRKVYPYYYTFGSFVKGRWMGKTVLEVYKSEFKQTGVDPETEITSGNILVNGEKTSSEFILGDNMRMEHRCHRHEMPVLDVPIDIIEDTEELIVINKPASIPVHPCGRYRYNSITMLLKHEFGYDNLRILYRLDRLTSGVLIMPKTTSVSKKLEKQLEKRELHKEYVSRVDGKFPDGDVVCNEPLGCLSKKTSLYKVDPTGKPSSTTFTRLSYNGKTSVVKCVPHTGRTHQIRVHLQFLGYPISNDPLYNSPAFGPNRGKGGIIDRSEDEIATEIMKTSNIGAWKIGDNPKYYEKFGHKHSLDCSMTSGDNVPSAESTENTKSGARQDASENIDMKEIADSANENVKEKENKVNLEHDKGDKIGKLEDCKVVNDVCDQFESGSLEPELNKTVESSEVKGVDVKDSENVNEESELPCKRIRTDNKSVQSSDVPTCSSGTSQLQENLDKLKTEETKVSVGNSQSLDIQKSSENLETSHRDSNKDKSGKPVLGWKVTDAELIDSKMGVDEFCEECKHIYEDPKPEELIIYLHAVTYKGPTWEYSTPLPYWAAEDFDEESYSGTR